MGEGSKLALLQSALKPRGSESIKIEGSNNGSDAISIFVSSDNSDFDVLIASGEKIKKDQPFTIHVVSPIDGDAIIYEELAKGLDNTLGAEKTFYSKTACLRVKV